MDSGYIGPREPFQVLTKITVTSGLVGIQKAKIGAHWRTPEPSILMGVAGASTVCGCEAREGHREDS